MTDLLWKFSYGSDDERDSVKRQIQSQGEAALSSVIMALSEEFIKTKQIGIDLTEDGVGPLHASPEPLIRLAELLTTFQRVEALLPLLMVAQQGKAEMFQTPYLRLCEVLEARASAEDLVGMVNVLSSLRNLVFPPPQVMVLARALVRMAEREPHPELQKVLPLLRYRLTAPVEFIALHRRLKAALGAENLPIPAAARQTTQDLPIPRQEQDQEPQR
jgi:hypothetical protein